MTSSRTTWSIAGGGLQLNAEINGAEVTFDFTKKGKTTRKSRAMKSAEEAMAVIEKELTAYVSKGLFTTDVEFERVPWGDFEDQLRVAGNSEDPDDLVLVFRGDLVIPHNLWLDYREGILGEGEVGLFVDGNLTVEGAILNFEDDYGPFLQVTGNLTARSIATGGSQIRVDVDVHADVVVGVYNHGCVDIGGTLHTRLVASEHTVTASVFNGLNYSGWGGAILMWTDHVPDETDPFDIQGVFVKALISGDSVDLARAREFCEQGRPVVLDAPLSVRAAFRKLVAKKLEAPEKVKSLAITGKDLTVLPPEILLFPMLEKLDLTHNKLRTLPEEIGQLKHLKELKLRGNGLQYLPESIGRCTELREIDLEANCLVGLPDSLANCTQLRLVNLRNNPYSYVRRSFGGWQNVKFMNELPEVLTRLPNLEKLDFDDTMIRKMPARPFLSNRLKGVVYEDTLLQEVDPEIHPQIPAPDLDKSRRWAAAHVGFWFDSDHVRPEYFYEFKSGNYDFSEMRALLKIVMESLVPAAAPYDEALEKFKAETADIVRRLLWNEELGRQHVRLLFENLLDELDRIESGLGAPLLTDGVRTVFQGFLGQGV